MGNWKIVVAKESTNFIRNPSFEKVTTYWTSAHTIARSSEQAWSGAYSLKVTDNNTSTTLLSLSSSSEALPTLSVNYRLQCRVYVPSGWDGGNISIIASSLTGATVTVVKQFTAGTDPYNEWVRLETRVVLSTDNTGTVGIASVSNATAGKIVYVDGWQSELEKIGSTDPRLTYFDGDYEGCSWEGESHVSRSYRPIHERGGGLVYDLEDLGAYVEEVSGAGAAANSPIVYFQGASQLPVFGGITPSSRRFIIGVGTLGDTRPDVHSKRATVLQYLSPDGAGVPQPVTLFYHGRDTNTAVKIGAVVIGEDSSNSAPHTHYASSIQLLALDPNWYREALSGVELNYVSQPSDLQYIDEFGRVQALPLSTSTTFTSMAETKHYLYVSSTLTNIDGDANCDYIARYDKSERTWSAPWSTNVPNGSVYKLIVDPEDETQFWIFGAFTLLGAGSYSRAAKWNGSSWSALGTGLNGTARCAELDSVGNIWVGGSFTTAGGTTVNYVAKWNGSAWSALGSGTVGTGADVWDIRIHPENDDVYIVGAFDTAGGFAYKRFVIWDQANTVWKTLGSNAALFDGATGHTGWKVSIADDGRVAVAMNLFCYVWTGAEWEEIGYLLPASGSPLYAGVNWIGKELWLEGNTSIVSGPRGKPSSSTAFYQFVWSDGAWRVMDFDGSSSYDFVYFNPATRRIWLCQATLKMRDQTTLSYSGTARTTPFVRVERRDALSGSVVLLLLANRSQPHETWFFYSIGKGEELIIDYRPGMETITSSVNGVVWSALTRSSQFSGLSLLPGDNLLEMAIFHTGTTEDSSILRTMYYREAYTSLDGAG